MSEVEAGQGPQSPAVSLVVQPALRHEARRIRKQTFVAADAVQIRLTVSLNTQHVSVTEMCMKSFPYRCLDVVGRVIGRASSL